METAARYVGWLPLIPLLPLIGFVVNGLMGKRLGRRGVGFVAVSGPLCAFALALAATAGLGVADRMTAFKGGRRAAESAGLPAYENPSAPGVIFVPGCSVEETQAKLARRGLEHVHVATAGEIAPHAWIAEPGAWIELAGFRVGYRFVLDRLSAVLALVVLGVGTLIHIYSLGYMAHEERGSFARYFAYLNFFMAMMLVLVTAGDLLLLFVGWEGVGLASYLLIGFEYREGWKADAGIKAFVVNRVGDLGFILGAITLATAAAVASRDVVSGELRSALASGGWLRIDLLRALAMNGTLAPATLGVACLLLFIGATGKSAQIPLFVWLPDAMAGPTPVSALIHAATMVTAGVYMVARLFPLFEHAVFFDVPVLAIVAAIGVATAFLAGTAAVAQDDVKKVLAYSTVSQLGYMFVGAGAGAAGTSVFHLVTHAFFKALLFLGAGALIHATGTQDLRKMGGLRERLPLIRATMVIGALALAGVPPFSGFFSKDAILVSVLARAGGSHEHAWAWHAVYGVGLATAALTAFYSARLVTLAFEGEPGEVARQNANLHDAPPIMGGPLMVLAALATIGGLLSLPPVGHLPGAEALTRFLAPVIVGKLAVAEHAAEGAEHGLSETTELAALGASAAVAIGMFLLGRALYVKPSGAIADLEAARAPFATLRPFLERAWRVDELYYAVIARPLVAIARRAWAFVDDLLLDRVLVDGAGRVAEALSLLARVWQTGRVPRYAAYFAIGVVAALAAAVL